MKLKPRHIISTILAVVIVGGLAWWGIAHRTQVLPTPTPVVNNLPTPLDQEGWKTYRNEEYGFEFQYPKNINGKLTEITSKSQTVIGPYGDPTPPGAPAQKKFLFGKLFSVTILDASDDSLSININAFFNAESVENYFSFGGGADGGPEYRYDSVNQWWNRNLSDGPLTLSWDEFFSRYQAEKTAAGNYVIKIKSFPQEFAYAGELAGCPRCGYHIFNSPKTKYVHIAYGGSLRDRLNRFLDYRNYSGLAQNENLAYQEALETTLEQIAMTVRFF